MSQKAKQQNYGDMFWRLERIHNALQESHLQSLKPIAVYVDSIMPVQKRMADILPRRETCEKLVQSYVSVSEGLYRVIHVPTFMQEFNAYWAYGVTGNVGGVSSSSMGSSNMSNMIGTGTRAGGPTVGGGAAGAEGGESRRVQGATEDFLPRLLCILCIGSRFETESKGLTYEWSDGVHIPTACALVRSWLDGLRGKPSIDLNTLQTEVLLLHASRMILPPQRIWTELGMISRPAMAMGLHRDPSEFGADVTPFQAECRRKLWYTIMDMDLHVSLACGLPCAVRPGQFTCRPPRNLDDTDLYPEMTMLPPGKPMDHHTEGLMQLFAADTLPLRMRASELLSNVDYLTNYWEVLNVGGELEKALDDINCLFPRNTVLDSHQAHREWRTRAMLDMHVRRPLLSLYRPFALSLSAEYPPPEAISDVYLKSSMAMLTYMDELDSSAPSYDHVSHMYYVMLRNDIVQAAFSVCYYIVQAAEIEMSQTEGDGSSRTSAGNQGEGSATPPAHGAPSPSAMSGGSGNWGAGRYSGNNSAGDSSFGTGGGRHNTPLPATARKRSAPIWSSIYMIRTVERTLNSLARLVNDLSFDLRDVVALAVVLGSVMPASSPAQRSEHIHLQVGHVLDTCTKQLCGHSSTAVGRLTQSLCTFLHFASFRCSCRSCLHPVTNIRATRSVPLSSGRLYRQWLTTAQVATADGLPYRMRPLFGTCRFGICGRRQGHSRVSRSYDIEREAATRASTFILKHSVQADFHFLTSTSRRWEAAILQVSGFLSQMYVVLKTNCFYCLAVCQSLIYARLWV